MTLETSLSVEEEKYLRKYGLDTGVVALTDGSGTDFRMSDNSGATS